MTETTAIRCVCGHAETSHHQLYGISECIMAQCDCLRFRAPPSMDNDFSDEEITKVLPRPAGPTRNEWESISTETEELIDLTDEVDFTEFEGPKTQQIPVISNQDLVWGPPYQCEECGHTYRKEQFRVCPECKTDLVSVDDKKGLRSA